MKAASAAKVKGRPREFDRDAALRAAMKVFWERGYEGTSIGDLTAALGIAKPSLYAAFGCKEALFLEAVALYDLVEGAAAEDPLETAPTARAAVEAMLRANVDAYTRPGQPKGCMIVLAALLGTAESRPVRVHLAELRSKGQAALEARLVRGVRDGDLPTTIETAAMASFYTTVLQGLSIQARDGASPHEMNRIVDSAMLAWETLTQTGSGPGATRHGPSRGKPSGRRRR
jgi:AcrR family transcriptional regulator